MVLIISLRLVMMRENARRDQINGGDAVVEGADVLALTDQTDTENLRFRYLL